TFLTAGTFRWGGTAGQAVVDASAGGAYVVGSGFFFSGTIATGVGLPAPPANPDSIALPRAFAFRIYTAGRNPGGPPVSIGFDLPETENIRLAVFSPEGRRLRVLADGPAAAGSHRLEWDGSDERGRVLGSGIYLVRLESSTRVSQRKLVLVR